MSVTVWRREPGAKAWSLSPRVNWGRRVRGEGAILTMSSKPAAFALRTSSPPRGRRDLFETPFSIIPWPVLNFGLQARFRR